MQQQTDSPTLMKRLENLFCCSNAKRDSKNEQVVAATERIPYTPQPTLSDSKVEKLKLEQHEQDAAQAKDRSVMKLGSSPVDADGDTSARNIADEHLQESRSFYLTHQVVEVPDVYPIKLHYRRYLESDRKPRVELRGSQTAADNSSLKATGAFSQTRAQTPQKVQSQILVKEIHQVNKRQSVPKITFTYQPPGKVYERQSRLHQLAGPLETNPVSFKVAESFSGFTQKEPIRVSQPNFVPVKSIVQEAPANRVMFSSTNFTSSKPVESYLNLNPELPSTADFRDKFKLSEVVNSYPQPIDTFSVSQTPKQMYTATTPKDMLGSSQAIPFPETLQQ